MTVARSLRAQLEFLFIYLFVYWSERQMPPVVGANGKLAIELFVHQMKHISRARSHTHTKAIAMILILLQCCAWMARKRVFLLLRSCVVSCNPNLYADSFALRSALKLEREKDAHQAIESNSMKWQKRNSFKLEFLTDTMRLSGFNDVWFFFSSLFATTTTTTR